MPCSTTVVGRSPQSQAMALKAVTWATSTSRSRGSVQHRVPLAHGVLGGRVVLEVDRGQVGAHPPAGPPLDEVDLVRPLEHDDVDLLVGSASGVTSRALAGQSQVRARPRPSGPAVGQDRQQVSCGALDQRGQVGAVHVPDEDPHDAPHPPGLGAPAGRAGRPGEGAHGRRRRRAPDTIVHGWPGTGQVAGPGERARRPAGRRARRWARPTGRHRSSGTTGANRLTTGVPTAAARCAGPVLPTTTAPAPASTPASSARRGAAGEVDPAGRGHGPARPRRRPGRR